MDYVNGQMSMYNDRFAYSTCGGVHESNIQLALITPTLLSLWNFTCVTFAIFWNYVVLGFYKFCVYFYFYVNFYFE